MKVNRLLSDVLRGEWLIEPHHLLGYAPIIQKIISGEAINFENTTKTLLQVIDKNGQILSKDEDGNIEVPKNSYAVISMMGAVVKYGDFCTYGADEIVRALAQADANPNIMGTIFQIDGPGGAVSAIGPFLQFAKTKTKPVVAIMDAAMSLHYWTAVSVADYLIADNDVSARFGSVGVVSSFVDSRKVMEERGYVFHEIYPDESANKNEDFRLALEGKYDMIKKNHLRPIALKFQGAVRAGRPNLKEEKGVLTGATFDADTSLAYGMIDKIGSFADAMNMVDRLSTGSNLKSILNNY
jgi:protease-4